MQLTQKETELLKDLKGQEQLCIEKYKKNASNAKDQQLTDLFNHLAAQEQKHLDTIVQMENGTVPAQGSGQSGNQAMPTFTATYDVAETANKKNDCYLCSDLLAAEKHASHLYDTCIFEFDDENARDALNQIQKEEQNHGKMIYDYMSANKMYA